MLQPQRIYPSKKTVDKANLIMAALPGFAHDHLDSSSRDIRVVILEPSTNPQDIIKCSLVRTSLDHSVEFEALSYQWGEPGGEKEIIINGICVSIRANLWNALWHIRGTETRTLWIDAICINQKNVTERNHQVQQMGQIYKTSWRVLIWLGLPSDDSDLALGFITSVGKATWGAKFNSVDRELYAVRRLCQRSYWERLWIVQEVMVADLAMIQCGGSHTSWNDFRRFKNAFKYHLISTPPEDGFTDLHSTSPFSLAQHHLCAPRLKELLETFSSSLCSEPRDKIYGLSGVAKDTKNFPIDYSKSMFDIFNDVIALQRYEDCPTLIAFSQFLQNLLQGHVKSSVTNSAHIQEEFTPALGYVTGRISKLGPLYKDAVASQNGKSSLETFLGQRGEEIRDQIDDLLSARILHQMQYEVLQISSHGSCGFMDSNWLDFYGPFWDRSGKIDWSTWASDMRPLPLFSTPEQLVPWDYLENVSWFKQNKPEPLHPENVSWFKQNKPEPLHPEIPETNPLFFMDHKGHIGIAPSNTRIGDFLCRFRDCDVIAILRRSLGTNPQDKKSRTGEDREIYSIVGRAMFPRRGNEGDGFNARINLWLNGYALQLLTQ